MPSGRSCAVQAESAISFSVIESVRADEAAVRTYSTCRLVDAEPVRGDRLRLLDDLARPRSRGRRRRPRGCGCRRCPSRAATTDVSPCSTSISSTLVAEPVGDDLRPRRLVPLAVRRRAGQRLHRPGREAADRRRVPAARAVADRAEDLRRREPAHLDVRREADAEPLRVAALARRSAARAASPRSRRMLERAVERRVVVARVDRQPGGDRRRELADEVQPPQLDRIHARACARARRPHARSRTSPPAAPRRGTHRSASCS